MKLDDVIQELRELNEPVPKPLRLPSPEEVQRAEATLGVVFHPDYRKYLQEASDVVYGTKEPATVVPGGAHTDLVETSRSAWEDVGVPGDLLPICEDNGDYYCMTRDGGVVLWSHDADGTADERWADLATWIKDVWIEEGWEPSSRPRATRPASR